MYETSSAKAIPCKRLESFSLALNFCDLCDRARLEINVKHNFWYLASNATISPALSFANKLSCKSRAICRTRLSISIVETLCSCSLDSPVDLLQKKHNSLEREDGGTLLRVYFFAHTSFSSDEEDNLFSALLSSVVLNFELQLLCHLALCVKRQCSIPYPSSKTSIFILVFETLKC